MHAVGCNLDAILQLELGAVIPAAAVNAVNGVAHSAAAAVGVPRACHC